MGKKIALMGLYSILNMGDRILCDTTEYLIRQEMPDAEIIKVDAFPVYRSLFSGIDNFNYRVSRKLELHGKKKFEYTDGSMQRYRYERAYIRLRFYRYYKKMLRDVDAIIFAGGGFVKFRTQGLNYCVEMAGDIARKRNIPVMLNAIGIEGFDINDERCRALREYLNSGQFKVITTRDDIDILDNGYIQRDDIVTARVGDPALWSPECYGVSRTLDEDAPIGINVVRGGVFQEYGNRLDYDDVKAFYCELLRELDRRGMKWVLFTNGLKSDQRMARKILADLGLEEDGNLLPEPGDPETFLDLIKSFRCIFGARLHASITSYALDVPVTGFIWNEKIRMFAEVIGKPQNFLEEDEIDAVRFADLLQQIQTEQYDTERRSQIREQTREYLARFLNDHLY
ncbi:MAG: polysaccharide pyruvyl transferase family protein [Mogibacterium sp.]|nr:polysaccharide pyruvyl transferase family protein [Mogibacterium sp.]MBQ6501017.1 polysaccharide pyruvyl transferase family protein [Mogibacterium sp.]